MGRCRGARPGGEAGKTVLDEQTLQPADRDAYLQRVGLDGSLQRDGAGLAALQEAHLRAIPFENLDIPLGRGIGLDLSRLLEKLVHARRGGFCFEQNTLFAAALRSLGFPVRAQLARVFWRSQGQVNPRTHHVLLVEADGTTWLADAGFGGPGLRRPIAFQCDTPVDQGDARYRLRAETHFGYLLEREGAGAWEPLYSFDLEPCWPADFEMGCHFAASHPDSLFTNHLLVTRLTETGRIWLLDDQLTLEEAGAVTEKRALESPAAFRAAMATHFGLTLTVADAERLAQFR